MKSAPLYLAVIASLLAPSLCSAAPERPLLAHWTFDEVIGARCRDAGPAHLDAVPDFGAESLRRLDGLFGPALAFAGDHRLQADPAPAVAELAGLTFSAWVAPSDLSGYRQILRKEDGDQRLLFSFQGDGAILSLGLNVDGYVECDAAVEPVALADGRWHHCAATFDGSDFRVYLDGAEVGSLHRPGALLAGGPAPLCIGSANGGECYRGLMDDLRFYSVALTAEEIASLHREGLNAQEAAAREIGEGASGPTLAAPLLAQWTLDGRGLVSLLTAEGGDRSLDIVPAPALATRNGVHGRAIELEGRHALPVVLGPTLDGLEAVSFSAWVRPRNLSGYREILRQECANRVLFSFQENGAVLALGLNVDGYAECDAPIDPAKLLDGAWHHCAATFDGQAYRVYLDGEEIGTRERPGALAVDRQAPAFIGSSSGQSEWYEGGLDDLRIYRAALAPEQIRALRDAGLAADAQRAGRLTERVAGLYERGDDLAATLSLGAERYATGQTALDLDLADALEARIRADFPEPCERLAAWAGLSPLEVIADPGLLRAATGRLRDLLLEYEPLTPEQWAQQSEEQAAKWREVRGLAERLARLEEQGASAEASPEWLRLVFEMGARIEFRPWQHEAVAPYRTPETPVTRDRTADEAQAALRRDWLFQADGNPSPERIQREIGWTRDLAARLAREGVDLDAETEELAALEARSKGLAAPDEELYLAIRALKRRIAFRNPALDFSRVVFVDTPFPQGSEWLHETRHRLGYMAVPGGRLLVLDGLSPAGHLRQLAPEGPIHGSFWRPDVSFDGTRVLFCMKPHNEKSFHLYEVGADGTGLRQLTRGPYDDLDPIYLPDGRHIAFSTTRAHTYVRCMPPTNAFVLARCDLTGKGMYLISCNNEPDYLPSMLRDGRILYTRWEYTDKPLWRAQGLWTMNPDGTQSAVHWGNQSVWPDLLKDAREIPGSRRVMFTGSAHHNWFAGSVGIVDAYEGLNFPSGVTKVTAETEWPESGNGPSDPIEAADYHTSGRFDAYYSPFPLTEEDFLVSAQRGGKFALYLMDVHGNRELIWEGTHQVLHAIPLRPRPTPTVLPDRVAWPSREEREHPKPGAFLSANVYEGTPPSLHGKVRFLRVLSIDPKTYTYWYQRPYISTGPVVSMVQSEGVKRILGTVPVAEDGSVSFEAPAGAALHFQLLDENRRALQTMRSFAWVMPGERRGCVGCHEQHSVSPATPRVPESLAREPVSITPPPWDDRTVGFKRYVQPVLDRYCGACHQGDGEARTVLDLTERPGFLMFDEPYVTLIGQPSWGAPYVKPESPPPGFGAAGMIPVEGYSTVDPAAYVTPAPMTALSYRSRLVEIASSGAHHGVKVDPVSLERLTVWVDAMCPYIGEDEIRAIPDPDFQGVDWLAVRPRIATAPRTPRPGPLDD